ncbi:MAG: hypothetical protein AAGC93_15215 [Cyanobacteria bacterium P01_F01_bin.53]
MSYLTPVDQSVLRALTVGLFSGAAISCINAGLDDWKKRDLWNGWDTIIRTTILYAIIFGLIFSAGAFVLTLYAPSMPLAQINQRFLGIGLGAIIVFPLSRLITGFMSSRAN